MIRSMTGFGRATGAAGAVQITIDVRSVNHRFLDLNLRAPREYGELEAEIRNRLQESVSRGRVDVFVNRSARGGGASELVIDQQLARSFADRARKLAAKIGVSDAVSLDTILAQTGVVSLQECPPDLKAEKEVVFRCLDQAVRALRRMQAIEGRALKADLTARLKAIEGFRKEILRHVPEIQTQIRDKLVARIAELSGGVAMDPDRVTQEVAYLAGRGDITEEVVRLKSHLEQMRQALSSKEPIGRRLDFLLQETNREITTIGSKIGNSDVARIVVDVKSELEKIREQAQNIE